MTPTSVSGFTGSPRAPPPCNMSAPMELQCWRGDWGLPSVEPGSLTVMAYAKFAGAPLKLQRTNNPWWTPTGSLPVFKSGKNVITQPLQILDHLRKQNFNADYGLSPKEGADTLAFIALVEQKLQPALTHAMWLDPVNYVELTRPWHGEAIPFPLNFVLPNRMHHAAEERLRQMRGGDADPMEEAVQSEIYAEAMDCLSLLSHTLGDKEYFFRDSPSTLDAVVLGHVAPLLLAPLPSAKLQQHLKGLDNLCRFCQRILAQYFPQDEQDGPRSKNHQRRQNEPAGSPSEGDHEPHKLRNQLLSLLVAVGAMVGYALFHGLVTIERVGGADTDADIPTEMYPDGGASDDDDGGDS
uniref:Metaxin n=1 Tax=Petromyzon marinus TaxID=7757 RepID=A0AAJ7U8H0_PETMA|nr:metaxin-1-like isoform X1 [Petromyzon marinus]